MGLRFNRRVRLIPGLTLNFSKRGISTSIGVRGAKVTLGHGEVRRTIGLPGTGLSHTTITSIGGAESSTRTRERSTLARVKPILFILAAWLAWRLLE
jgi:hypothetical protein